MIALFWNNSQTWILRPISLYLDCPLDKKNSLSRPVAQPEFIYMGMDIKTSMQPVKRIITKNVVSIFKQMTKKGSNFYYF